MSESYPSRPLISVVIPCFKQAHLLPCAIASVQAQSVTDWEIIVVNDGSPDDTSDVVRRMQNDDPRISLIEQANGGLSSARNAGIRSARGRYLQFLDADDYLNPEKFAHDLSLMDSDEGLGIVISDFRYLRDGQLVQDEYTEPRFVSYDYELELAIRWETDLSIPIHAALFDRRLFANGTKLFNTSLPNHEDFEMWMRLLAERPTVRYTQEVDAVYRCTSNGMTRNRQAMYDGYIRAIETLQKSGQLRSEVRGALRAKVPIVDNSYGLNRRSKLRKFLEAASARRLIPWRVQAYFQRLFRIDPRAQVWSVCRSMGVGVR
jgi:glycosyltransferase involved in cell wall biosynthesis